MATTLNVITPLISEAVVEKQQTVADLLNANMMNPQFHAVINKETKKKMRLDEIINPNQTVVILKAIKGGWS